MRRKNKTLSILPALLLAGVLNTEAYDVWLGLPYIPRDSAEQIDQWDLTAAQAAGLNLNTADAQRYAPEQNTTETLNATINEMILAKNCGMEALARTKFEYPDMPQGLVRPTLEEKLTEIFTEAESFSYEIKWLMLFANKLSEDPENPTIFYTAQEFQDVRDWLDHPTNGYSDVRIMYNVRNNSDDSKNSATNVNIEAILLEAEPGKWFDNTGDRQGFLSWAVSTPAVNAKEFVFQIPLSGIPEEEGAFAETRRLVSWISSSSMLGSTDFIRRDDVHILPLTYLHRIHFYPEMDLSETRYADSLTGVALSLIEQKDLFEGRLPGGLPTDEEIESFERHVPGRIAAVSDNDLNNTATWNGSVPAVGDTNLWSSESHRLSMATNTETFHGKQLLIQSGGELRPGIANAELSLNDLILGGGEIYAANNGGIRIDLSGGTFFLNEGTIKAGSVNSGRDIRFRNGGLSGYGNIHITAQAATGSDVEFEDTVSTRGFTGIFHIQDNGILNLPPVAPEDASFGISLSGSGLYFNDADIAVDSLVIDGTSLAAGTYTYASLTSAQQAFVGNNGGTIRVMPAHHALNGGLLNSTEVWEAPPVSGDQQRWEGNGHTFKLSTASETFHGEYLILDDGSRLEAGKANAYLTLNNLILDGGTLYMGNNLGFDIDFSGQTLLLRSGTFEAGSDNVGRDIFLHNGTLAGSGTIDIIARGADGSEVEFQNTVDTTGFTGAFSVHNNGILSLPPIATADASFGIHLSGNGFYVNETDVALTTLTIDGTAIPNGVYTYADFTAAQQAFIGNKGGTITVTAAGANSAPVFAADPIAGSDATEDALYSSTIAGSASDADVGDVLTYAKVSGPAWLSVASSGALSGTPSNADVGLNSFTVSVSDGTAPAVQATLEVAVLNVNDAPVFAADPIAGSAATEDALYSSTIAGSASDIDVGDTLTYARVSGPAWLSVGSSGALSGTPSNADVGLNSFIVSVSDGTAPAVQATLEVAVLNVNDVPVFAADPIAGSAATEDAPYSDTIAGSASDADVGDTLAYAKVSGPSWLSVGSSGALSGTPSNADIGLNSFTISVSDGTAPAVQATLEVTVLNVNDAPTFTADPIVALDAAADEAYVHTLSGSALDEDVGDVLTYSKVSGPAWLSVASDGALSGTPSAGDAGTNVFVIQVEDLATAADTATLNIFVDAPAGPDIRVTEYYLTTGEFSGTAATLTLNQDLAADYYILIRGSRTGDGTSNPNNDYARVVSVPGGKGDLADSGATDQIGLQRQAADHDWEGVVTVVECGNSNSDAGFKLVDAVETAMNTTSGTDTSAAWSDISQVVLFGGYRGGGVEMFGSPSNRKQGTGCYTRLYPSGSGTLNWTRDAGGETMFDATMTTFVVEWGGEWTVQHVNVSGSNGGGGADATGEYTTATISSVTRDHTWVWGSGTRADSGIGDNAESCLITLGDGVNQNASETSVAVGSEYTDAYNFDVYVLTHPDIAVDHRFKIDGDSSSLDLGVTVDAASTGARFGWVYNGCNGTGAAFPRPRMWARYTTDSEVMISRGYDGQPFPAWVQGIDLSGLNE